jgi:pantetheine-phosphate adenylyltransferase
MFSGNGQERIATIGGTFDVLHIGHKEYIRLAFEYADRVLIYVNSDEYTNGKKHYSVRSFEYRVERLKDFIREIGCENRYEIHCLHKLEQLEIDYLETDGLGNKIYMAIVSPDYYDFFLNINHIREARGMKSFLILVKLRKRDNENKDISSSLIHNLANLHHAPNLELSLQ